MHADACLEVGAALILLILPSQTSTAITLESADQVKLILFLCAVAELLLDLSFETALVNGAEVKAAKGE